MLALAVKLVFLYLEDSYKENISVLKGFGYYFIVLRYFLDEDRFHIQSSLDTSNLMII